MNTPGRNSRFPYEDHEDQNKKRTKFDEFMDFVNDHEENQSLMGHRPSEYDEGLALDYHKDNYDPHDISRVHPDDEIKAVIKELFHNSNRIDASDIVVDVDHSNVSLSGTVKSQFERDYALSVVKLVHGVGEVQSDLIVKINPGILPTDVGRNP